MPTLSLSWRKIILLRPGQQHLHACHAPSCGHSDSRGGPGLAHQLHQKWMRCRECAKLTPMETRLIGIVQTENPEDSGRIIFTLLLGDGSLVACRSGAGYKSAKPKRGDKVAVVGDTIRELIKMGESHDFFYSSLEILTPAANQQLV
jgi:hypothetical protein